MTKRYLLKRGILNASRRNMGKYEKNKSRFCVRGNIQKRVSSDTLRKYATVVVW